jgi:exosortase
LFRVEVRRLDAGGLLEWFTWPDGLWFPLVLAGASLLAWRRRGSWSALPEQPGAPWPAIAALLASAGALLWSRLTGVEDLLIWSFTCGAAGVAAWRKGPAGIRVMVLPILLLLFAVAPPPRLVSEAFWWIQSQSARAAATLVYATGAPVLGEGIVLTTPAEVFGIVESCAALGLLVVLTAGAMLGRERIAQIGPRSWLLVLLAPAVALALNLARITSIVLHPPINHLHHLGQWAILLGVGAGVLAAIGGALARLPAPARRAVIPDAGAAPVPAVPAAAALVCLAALSLLPTPEPAAAQPGPARALPEVRGDWTSQEVEIDRLFLGFVQFRKMVARRYRRDDTVVDLFLGEASQRSAWSSPFSPKTILPGLRWVPLRVEGAVPLDLPRPPDQTALVAREGERWWVAQWRFGDPGLLRESLRQLFALDASPFGKRRTRRVLRIATPVDPTDRDGVEAAQSTVALFAREFEDALYLDAARDSR